MASVYKRGGKKNRHGNYYISWTDHTGKHRTKSSGTTDKATAIRMAAKYEDEAAQRRAGLVDPQMETFAAEAQRPLSEHLSEYEKQLRVRGRADKTIKYAVDFVRRIVEFTGIDTVNSFTNDALNSYAEHLRSNGRSARTIGAHLSAAKAFTRWLVQVGKLPRDPLAGLKSPNPNTDRRRPRRMLLYDECSWLLEAAISGRVRYGMTGVERSLLYRLAIQTGLRAKEIDSLSCASIVVDGHQSYIFVPAANTKNREVARQVIPQVLANDLLIHASGRLSSAKLFNLPYLTNLARMLRQDLRDARDSWAKSGDPEKCKDSDFLMEVNSRGERLDFHSLRHTCASWLVMDGCNPKVVQSLMRHSDISLTMDTYGHLSPTVETEAAQRLGDLIDRALRPGQEARSQEEEEVQRHAQRTCRDTMQQDAATCSLISTSGSEATTLNPLIPRSLDSAVQLYATEFNSSGGGIRTPDTRIMIPLL